MAVVVANTTSYRHGVEGLDDDLEDLEGNIRWQIVVVTKGVRKGELEKREPG